MAGMDNQALETLKTAGDTVSITTLLAALAGLLPHVATLLTIVWAAMRIYEQWLRIRRLKNEDGKSRDRTD